MNAQEWRQLEDLFEEVMRHPYAARSGVLAEIGSRLDNPELLDQLQRLVDHGEPGSEFLRPIERMKPAKTGFSPGDSIGERFEIRRFLGRGGMGVVYEALDRVLGERVAVKVIAGDIANQSNFLERFQREVQVARRVTHPNVCRIHDLGAHEGTPYLTMELIEGETLASRIALGPLPFEEWEPLALQLFDALAAAHAVGVVHRDLKPANLMLAGSRLVILDFGLARALASGDGSLTATGTLAGTLDWMAPEQLRGEWSAQSDVYSAALILLSAIGGGNSGGATGGLAGALRRATDGNFRPQVPPALPKCWKRILLRCLDRDPERRPKSARKVLELSARKWMVPSLPRPPQWSWPTAAVVAAIVVALFFAGFRYLRYPGLKPGTLVMVVSTRNDTGEPNLDGVTAALDASLTQSARVNIWDRGRLPQVLRAMRRDPARQPDAGAWHEIAFRERAPLLIFSNLSRLAEGYSFTIQCEQIGSSPEPITRWNHTVTASGPAGLFEAVRDASSWIRLTLGESAADVSMQNRLPQDITSSSWEALSLFEQAQGLSQKDRAFEAIPVLERATQLDPSFAMALMRLGDILNSQHRREEGYDYWRRAIEQARNQRLSERERLIIESRYPLELGDFRAAEPVLRDWIHEYPNDPRAPEWLAACLLGLGRYPEAATVAREARRHFGPSLFGTAELIRGLAMRNQLEEIEPELIVLEMLPARMWALRFRGIAAAMKEKYDQAEQAFGQLAAASEGQDASRATSLQAALAAESGDFDRAADLLQEGITHDRQAGEEGLSSQKSSALAFVEYVRGKPAAARARALEAVARLDSPEIVMQSVSLLARTGFLSDAEQLARRMPSGEGPAYEARVLRAQGEIMVGRRDFGRAIESFERAARLDTALEPKEYLARAFALAGERERARNAYSEIVNTPWLIWESPESEWPGLRLLAKRYLQTGKGD